ncbi:MAG: rod shape-determining protein RodA [Lachnospiraceae bacterium]|nr:rod shape-determining protein RodA [Lachnospiraceae bacterium]
MFSFKNYKLKNFSIGLPLCVIALCILGYMVLSSALVNYADRDGNLRRQLTGMIIGGSVMVFLAVTDYHFWLKFHWLIYGFFLILLGLLFTRLGVNVKGATRWLDLPVVGRLQPSEFAKAGMILFFSWFFQKYQEKKNRFATVATALFLFLIPAVMIFLEPDLSTTLTFTLIFLTIFYVSGISYKWIGGMALCVLPVGGFLLWDSMRDEPLILKRYMLNRLLSFFNPDEYSASGLTNQQDRAVMAISSGRLSGKGLFNTSIDSVKAGNFLSEENSDFIFAVVGEELGFWGSIAVIGLFAVLVFICFRIAARAADQAGRLLAVGTGCFIGLQVFINIGVTSGILPNTGVVLPFFSHGISSLLCTFACLGLVMNVALQRHEADIAER